MPPRPSPTHTSGRSLPRNVYLFLTCFDAPCFNRLSARLLDAMAMHTIALKSYFTVMPACCMAPSLHSQSGVQYAGLAVHDMTAADGFA